MLLSDSFNQMVTALAAEYEISFISDIFFPPFYPGGQPKDSEFMAVMLESGSVGISYVLLPNDRKADYGKLSKADFIGQSPVDFALKFGSADDMENMLGLACLNAVCQEVMVTSCYSIDITTDSLGLSDIQKADRVGMVGFFSPLLSRVKEKGAELVIIEKDPEYIEKYPGFDVSLDLSRLSICNKVICTSTTVFNNTLDQVLSVCSRDVFVSIIGPTAGYFPDPLFKRGVNVVGGTRVTDGPLFMGLIAGRKRWGPATQKFCFQRDRYSGLPLKS